MSSTTAPFPSEKAPEKFLFSSAFWGEWFSRCVAFALPLAYFLITVSFYLRTYDSAQIKITLTQMGCGSVILFWILQLIFQKRWPFTQKDIPLVAPFLAILASGTLSYFHSSFRAGSLDEYTRRIFYCFMAFIVIAEFRGRDRQRRLLGWLVTAFALTVFYGFIQYFDGRLFPPSLTRVGLDPFIWRQAFGLRVFSTFGNPNFYGNFLVIITPILITLYFRNGGKIFRPFLLIGALVPVVVLADKLFANQFGGITAQNQLGVTLGLLGGVLAALALIWWKSPSASAAGMMIFIGATFVNLYATETKGAWVGFVGAVVASGILAGLFLVGPKARKITYGLLVVSLIVSVSGYLVVRHYAHQRKQSVDFRVFTWIATWDMIRTQPVLGTGIGSFKWAYPAFRRPEIILLEGRSNTETDHAEDEYLEVFYDEGGIGLGVFLWMILSVSVLGVRQLSRLTQSGPRAPPGPAFEDRAYQILAYLGAWWAALIHWFMDVSVRFVSSGIFSFFLPALVTSFVRNDPLLERQDSPRRMDPWVRLVTIGLWVGFFLFPDEHGRSLMRAPTLIFLGALLVVLAEILEQRITAAPFASLSFLFASLLCAVAELVSFFSMPIQVLSPMHFVCGFFGLIFLFSWVLTRRFELLPFSPTGPHGPPPAPWQWALAACALVLWGASAQVWRGYFLADLSHNAAIFFSKQTVWEKSTEFAEKVKEPHFPPDMREEYELVGGALEHYEKTCRLNPAFPMAKFFIGNVQNDWAAGLLDASRQARERGDHEKEENYYRQAVEHWDKALAAYQDLKNFAPNYVQTHHQMGLIHLKRGDMETALGQKDKAEEEWQKALKNFGLYHKLDPVFPPNYYRQSYIHFNRGDLENAEKSYLGALVYNSSNVVNRIYYDRNVETYNNLGRLFSFKAVSFPPQKALSTDPSFLAKAEAYYLKALEEAKKSGREDELGVESAKSLIQIYTRSGRPEKATPLWLTLREWVPNDPHVQEAFAPTAPAKR